MERFAQLFNTLDTTTKTNVKVAALASYFSEVSVDRPEDCAWALYFLSGRRLKRVISSAILKQWIFDELKLSEWLFLASYETVGDLAETIHLLLPKAESDKTHFLTQCVEQDILPLPTMDNDGQRAFLFSTLKVYSGLARFLFLKLLTGSFRVGVSQGLVLKGLSKAFGLAPEVFAQRLMGPWQPSEAFWKALISPETDLESIEVARPYPFCLAHPLPDEVEKLGSISDWQVEWKWDGIRGQLLHNEKGMQLWSRGEESIGDSFPDILESGKALPSGTVLDGEVLVWDEAAKHPRSFAQLQRRLGRKQPGKKTLQDFPAIYLAYDLLATNGIDVRDLSLQQRRQKLQEIFSTIQSSIKLSPLLDVKNWQELITLRDTARLVGAEGLMLKRLNSPYTTGRVTGNWWKYKLMPFTIDAVMMYAQAGHGRRASLYTDYTFGVWQDEGDTRTLVPFAKAYSGLDDKEINALDRLIRKHTIEKFGPVRSIEPLFVFELAFEGIQRSSRHKSGIAVRFPRILRWRQDKPAAEADSLNSLIELVDAHG
jgi:DNA ligase-1